MRTSFQAETGGEVATGMVRAMPQDHGGGHFQSGQEDEVSIVGACWVMLGAGWQSEVEPGDLKTVGFT